MEEKFSVGNPTKENIEYAFKNLIFYVSASIQLDIYQEYKNRFVIVLDNINDVLKKYINSGSLICVEEETLKNIRYDLIDLNAETLSLHSYYAEWSLTWMDAIVSLRIVEKNMGGSLNA